MNRHRIGCLVYLPKRSDDLFSVDDTKRECLKRTGENVFNFNALVIRENLANYLIYFCKWH